jgi:hypothetical protein
VFVLVKEMNMSELNKLLKAIQILIMDPRASLSRLLADDKKKSAQKKYSIVHGLPTINLLTLFHEFQITVKPYSFLEGTSTVLDIALLNALARKYRACKYLEIGTWRGESVANVARNAEKCISITLSEEELRKRGVSEEFIRTHRFYSEGLSNVEHIGHNSQTFNFSSLNEKFDLIFIDGDHSYEGVKIDTQNAFKMLKGDDSIIVWHDYGVTPETVRWNTLAGILDGCPDENRKCLYHVSNTLCAIFIKSEFETFFTKFPQIPDKEFEVTISARKV